MVKKKSVSKNKKNIDTSKLKKIKKMPKLGLKHALGFAVIVGIALIILSGWLWWTKILINPDRVLNDAISKNLQTNSVTRRIVQDTNGQIVDQTSYVSFFAPTITSDTVSKFSQRGSNNQTTVLTTNTIGTSKADFIQYESVQGAENLPGAENFQKLTGIWAKKDGSNGTGGLSFLNESLFSLVPFANLSNSDRDELIKLINEKNLYKYSNAERKSENGRQVYVYDVKINPADLIEVISKYTEMTNAADPAQFNPDDYKGAAPVPVQFTVDIVSRNLTKIDYGGSAGRTEIYSGYNLFRNIDIPKNTITIEELQQRLQGGVTTSGV